MCGVTPVAGAKSAALLSATQAGGSTAVAGAAGVAATGGGASPDFSAALQQLVAAVKALGDVIAQMSGAIAGGAAGVSQLALNNQMATQVAANNATQSIPGMADMAGMDMESMPHDDYMGAVNSAQPTVLQGSAKELLSGPRISAKDMSHATTTASGKIVFGRSAPEDRNRAAAVLNKLISSTTKYQSVAAAKAAGYNFDKFPVEGGGLVHAIRKGQDLNLDDPGMLLYRKQADGSLKLIGAALGSNNTAPDLGMGTWHVHGSTNINMMKHIWFTPNDLDTAFNETTPPASVI